MQIEPHQSAQPENQHEQQTCELELADGTRLVPQGEASPARLHGDSDHAFGLADVLRDGGAPFAGYAETHSLTTDGLRARRSRTQEPMRPYRP